MENLTVLDPASIGDFPMVSQVVGGTYDDALATYDDESGVYGTLHGMWTYDGFQILFAPYTDLPADEAIAVSLGGSEDEVIL